MPSVATDTIDPAPRPTEPPGAWWKQLALFLGLYAIALIVLLQDIGARPASPYNWENYTVRGVIDFLSDPSDRVLTLRDGLMTDSGNLVTVVGPIWLGMELGDLSLRWLRIPIVLISAFAVPLTWVLGRRLGSNAIGLAAAGLVLVSPAFILYARTATIVGMSITPALVTILVLHALLRAPRRWPLLILLQLLLVANTWFYGPIRFLWLIALVLLVVEVAFRRALWRWFLLCFVVTALILPGALFLLGDGRYSDPWEAVVEHYNGRGEQVFALADQPEGFENFIREGDEELVANPAANTDTLARTLIVQNVRDLRDLLLDRDTLPAMTDYWNERGRLHPTILVPFLLAGLALTLWQVFRSTEARLLYALLWGFSLPLLLTSRVHIGRLVFILPIIAILSAIPLRPITRWLATRQRPDDRPAFYAYGGATLAAMLVLLALGPGLRDWNVTIPPTRMSLVASTVDNAATVMPDRQLVYVFGDEGGREIELLNVGELQLALGDRVRFADSNAPAIVWGDGDGPLLLYGALLDKVAEPPRIIGYCDSYYLVEPSVEEEFLARSTDPAIAACDRALEYEVLPG